MSGMFARLAGGFEQLSRDVAPADEGLRDRLVRRHARQLETMQRVRTVVVDLAQARVRAEARAARLTTERDRLTVVAERAQAHGRDELAARALERKAAVDEQIASLASHHQVLVDEEEKLDRVSTRLQAKVEAFRTRKEAVIAEVGRDEARATMEPWFLALDEERADAELTATRAADTVRVVKEQGASIDAFIAASDAEFASGQAADELEEMADTADLTEELARLKAQLPSSPAGTTIPTDLMAQFRTEAER